MAAWGREPVRSEGTALLHHATCTQGLRSPLTLPHACPANLPGGEAHEISEGGLRGAVLAEAPHPQVEAEGIREISLHHHCAGAEVTALSWGSLSLRQHGAVGRY